MFPWIYEEKKNTSRFCFLNLLRLKTDADWERLSCRMPLLLLVLICVRTNTYTCKISDRWCTWIQKRWNIECTTETKRSAYTTVRTSTQLLATFFFFVNRFRCFEEFIAFVSFCVCERTKVLVRNRHHCMCGILCRDSKTSYVQMKWKMSNRLCQNETEDWPS